MLIVDLFCPDSCVVRTTKHSLLDGNVTWRFNWSIRFSWRNIKSPISLQSLMSYYISLPMDSIIRNSLNVNIVLISNDVGKVSVCWLKVLVFVKLYEKLLAEIMKFS